MIKKTKKQNLYVSSRVASQIFFSGLDVLYTFKTEMWDLNYLNTLAVTTDKNW